MVDVDGLAHVWRLASDFFHALHHGAQHCRPVLVCVLLAPLHVLRSRVQLWLVMSTQMHRVECCSVSNVLAPCMAAAQLL